MELVHQFQCRSVCPGIVYRFGDLCSLSVSIRNPINCTRIPLVCDNLSTPSCALVCIVLIMAGNALKRLMAEYKQLTVNPPEGIVAGPVDEKNFFEWEALIAGPEGTPFEGGVFAARLSFPMDYPLSPPKMQFVTDLFHPNIYPDGRVCISILHAPGDDPMGYESSVERWSPVQSVEKILLSVVSMLAEPNDESAANVDAAKTWREDKRRFNKLALRSVRISLGLPPE
ncbi:hypothetical protein CRM22_002350 [Opisthorchis felineus]|nr:hypothetical protein CRM22_002350 [Opisthorchis felineus]